MNSEPLQATRDINNWLSRVGLTVDDLQRMSANEQCALGRQWQSYQADVTSFQSNSGVTEAQLADSAMISAHAIPRLESPVPQKQKRVSFEEWSEKGQRAMRKHLGHE